MKLEGKTISLRTPVLTDAELILQWENSQEAVEVSGHDGGLTLEEIQGYVTRIKDVYLDKQLRFMICEEESAIGTIDLYDVNFEKGVAFVGVLIANTLKRKQGKASEAMTMLAQYCFDTLSLKMLLADVDLANDSSIAFFRKQGFKAGEEKNGIMRLSLDKRDFK